MRMKGASRIVVTLVTVLLLVLITACAPAPGEITPAPTPTPEMIPAPTPTPTPEPQPPPAPPVEQGIIEIRVTDPGVVGVTSANVTVMNIAIHPVGSGNWTIIIPGPRTFDLADLAETEAEENLGAANITAGNFTGIRMDVIGVNGWTDEDPSREYDAEVPSDKLRIVRPFTVEGGAKTVLTLDFDLTKSLIVTGSGKFLFKPVLHVKVAHLSPP